MPTARVNGVDIYYEEHGHGQPLILCHEFASDHRGWRNQVHYFSRRYRVVTYNHRGFQPSSVTVNDTDYEHDRLVEDLHQLIVALEIDKAHIAGFAIGAHIAVNFAIRNPMMVGGLILGGAGAGFKNPDFANVSAQLADKIASEGIDALVANIGGAPQRQAYRLKDAMGWDRFLVSLRSYSPIGAERVMRYSIGQRRPLSAMENELKTLTVPTLVLVGDQDYPAIAPSIFLSQTLPHAGLAVVPMSGHTVYLEEPALFNQLVAEFLANVENGRWGNWRADAANDISISN